jgi:hypothetical protein
LQTHQQPDDDLGVTKIASSAVVGSQTLLSHCREEIDAVAGLQRGVSRRGRRAGALVDRAALVPANLEGEDRQTNARYEAAMAFVFSFFICMAGLDRCGVVNSIADQLSRFSGSLPLTIGIVGALALFLVTPIVFAASLIALYLSLTM